MKVKIEVNKDDLNGATAICNPVERAMKRKFPEASRCYADSEIVLIELGRKTFKGTSSYQIQKWLDRWHLGGTALMEIYTPATFEIELVEDKRKVNEKYLKELLKI